ncbi:MAG: multinuclear nonheme iron-dependent oxidase, partial [Gammaproteobacteria bacterium]
MMPLAAKRGSSSAIPALAGIGLRAAHYREVLETKPAVGWFEVHSENYFGAGGLPLHYLERVRAEYPISLHGVGLSLGSADPLNPEHLRHLKSLVDRVAPGLVSEHLCWSSIGGRYLNDLVPLPYTEEALGHVAARVSEVQEIL